LAQWFQKRRLKTDNVLFDTFRPPISFMYFQSTKKNYFLHDHPINIPTMFGSNWKSCFREEDSQLTTPFLTQEFLKDHPMNIPTKFGAN
jgi:hypothetical protein